jgi:hypothetical protein
MNRTGIQNSESRIQKGVPGAWCKDFRRLGSVAESTCLRDRSVPTQYRISARCDLWLDGTDEESSCFNTRRTSLRGSSVGVDSKRSASSTLHRSRRKKSVTILRLGRDLGYGHNDALGALLEEVSKLLESYRRSIIMSLPAVARPVFSVVTNLFWILDSGF